MAKCEGGCGCFWISRWDWKFRLKFWVLVKFREKGFGESIFRERKSKRKKAKVVYVWVLYTVEMMRFELKDLKTHMLHQV